MCVNLKYVLKLLHLVRWISESAPHTSQTKRHFKSIPRLVNQCKGITNMLQRQEESHGSLYSTQILEEEENLPNQFCNV